MSRLRGRLTVRRILVALAVVAVLMSLVQAMRRRSDFFEQRARTFAGKVGAAYMDEQNYRTSRGVFGLYDPRTTAAYYQLVEHYDALRLKYERAAARPWWFVSPDPPEPLWPKGVRK
jgi:hypothetical protein